METRPIGTEHEVFLDTLPEALRIEGEAFDLLWNLHPNEHPLIRMHGRKVPIPRWQAAFGRDYHFSGTTSHALQLPPAVLPLLQWAQAHVDQRLDGVLVNWYDGALGHYIGPHRDSTQGLVPGSPIVTISFGEERVLRFRPLRGRGYVDVPAGHGSVIVIPYATNRTWKHEVPRSRRACGRRVSLTIRAFD